MHAVCIRSDCDVWSIVYDEQPICLTTRIRDPSSATQVLAIIQILLAQLQNIHAATQTGFHHLLP